MEALRTARGISRRLISVALGRKRELAAHALYHRFLRASQRFDPPEHPAMLSVLAAIASRSRTILDVGANVGRYSWFLQHHAQPGATLYALEPNPDAMTLLRTNLRGLENVYCLELALGERDGVAVLEVPADPMGNRVTALGHVTALTAGGEEPAGIEVGIRTLDGLVNAGAVRATAPVFMKIDVEGAEQRVLDGAAALVGGLRPVIYFECQRSHLGRSGGRAEDVWDFLSALGYVIFAPRNGLFHVCTTVDDPVPSYLAAPVPLLGLGAGVLSTEALIALLDGIALAPRFSPPAAPQPRTRAFAASQRRARKEALEPDR